MEQEKTIEVDRERYDELMRTEELYEELTQAIVGDKMQPPLGPLLALKQDAARYRYLRDRMPRQDAGQPVWLRRGDDLDEAVDAAIKDESK